MLMLLEREIDSYDLNEKTIITYKRIYNHQLLFYLPTFTRGNKYLL